MSIIIHTANAFDRNCNKEYKDQYQTGVYVIDVIIMRVLISEVNIQDFCD